MAKGAYIGINNIARKINGGYVGVSGVARRIKSAYIGIGGVARPCWSGGGELTSYGQIDPWATPRRNYAATSTNNYALFGGGYTGTAYSNLVDVYNGSLVRSTKTLSEARECPAATTVGAYVLFAGGYMRTYSATVDAFNSSLTRTNPTKMDVARTEVAATTVGNKALFGGGKAAGEYSLYLRGYCTHLEAYDSSLTHYTAATESFYGLLGDTSAATVGNYAIFAGVDYENSVGDEEEVGQAEAYDASLTQIGDNINTINIQRKMSTATVGDYAIFAGGYTVDYDDDVGEYCAASSTVLAINTSLTSTYLSDLSYSRWNMASTSLGNYALFAGGEMQEFYYDEYDESYGTQRVDYKTVDVYDASLTKLENRSLSAIRTWFAAASVGDYAIFAPNNIYNTVDVFALV